MLVVLGGLLGLLILLCFWGLCCGFIGFLVFRCGFADFAYLRTTLLILLNLLVLLTLVFWCVYWFCCLLWLAVLVFPMFYYFWVVTVFYCLCDLLWNCWCLVFLISSVF